MRVVLSGVESRFRKLLQARSQEFALMGAVLEAGNNIKRS